jgi:cytochrome c-type biogenesis protein CcmH/NrfG
MKAAEQAAANATDPAIAGGALILLGDAHLDSGRAEDAKAAYSRAAGVGGGPRRPRRSASTRSHAGSIKRRR